MWECCPNRSVTVQRSARTLQVSCHTIVVILVVNRDSLLEAAREEKEKVVTAARDTMKKREEILARVERTNFMRLGKCSPAFGSNNDHESVCMKVTSEHQDMLMVKNLCCYHNLVI